MICIGIDPGKSGAAVALRDGKMKICRFDKDTEQDVAKWLEAIDTAASWRGEKVFCFIEKVQPLPSFGGPAGTGSPAHQGRRSFDRFPWCKILGSG